MKHWDISIVINYEIKAKTREDAIEQVETEFFEDTHPCYEIRVNGSWEEE